MFGYYRFFLAALVLLSHIPIKLQGFDPGVAAVVSFYILAGYVVCKLFDKSLALEKRRLQNFYSDRLLRIFPLYIFVCALNVCFLLLTDYGSPDFNVLNTISSITVIPLNYFNDIDIAVLREPEALVIPPAWSLGAELQAYLLLPFVILFKRIRVPMMILSLLVFLAANLNVLNPEKFGYFYLPGVFFMFILGGCIFKLSDNGVKSDAIDHYLLVATYLALLLLIIFLGIYGKALIGHAMEAILGVLVGMPIIYYIANSSVKLPFNKFFGEMSYGVFLSHWLAIRCIDYFGWGPKVQGVYTFTAAVFVLTFIIALVGVLLIDRRVTEFRLQQQHFDIKTKSSV